MAGRGRGESEGRVLSLSLECIQDSVVNATIFAQNALGLQTTTYLYDRWNCLLPHFCFLSLLVTLPLQASYVLAAQSPRDGSGLHQARAVI